MKRGAGIILCQYASGEQPHFLGLIGPRKFQNKNCGTYDIPKGIIENNEDPWKAAQRECFEECGIFVFEEDLLAGPFEYENLTIWMAKCMHEPDVRPNPNTGVIEHLGCKWLQPYELLNDSYIYLRPAISWAIGELR
tara:strand:- start:6 stop:416 length:411 start_codon:yes stop_codon:yes gene_type:complete